MRLKTSACLLKPYSEFQIMIYVSYLYLYKLKITKPLYLRLLNIYNSQNKSPMQ